MWFSKRESPHQTRRRQGKLIWFAAIGLVAALCAPTPARATQSLQQTPRSNSSCGGVTACTVSSFTAIPAGSFICAVALTSSTGITAAAGSSNAGIWAIPSTCTGSAGCNPSDSTAGRAAIEYIASSTGSPTSISCTVTTAVMQSCEVVVITPTIPLVFDVGATRDASTAAAILAGTSPGTLTGTSDMVVQYGSFGGTASGCPNSAASPHDFPVGDAVCGLLNSTNAAAGTYTNTSGRAALGAIAFKETSAGLHCNDRLGLTTCR